MIPLVALIFVMFCSNEPPVRAIDFGQDPSPLQIAASSSVQWTGVAVSREKRIFVNYPRWRSGLAGSVAEIATDGSRRFYPSSDWNNWSETSGDDQHKFVCVQSVYIDDVNILWVLDTGNPFLQGVRSGAPKLVSIDIARDSVLRIYSFDSISLAPARYLNDVRIDTKAQIAYISESGLGAILVVDLNTGMSRLLLDGHISTTADDITFTVEGTAMSASIHCDGLALTDDGSYLYFKPLTGRSLFRIGTLFLQDTALTEAQLSSKVEFVAQVGVTDGLEFGNDGSLYITSLEDNSIKQLTGEGSLVTVVQDRRIKWPDSIAITEDNILYFTTSQIHLGANVTDPYRIFTIQLW